MRAGIVVNVTPEDRRRLEAIVADRGSAQKHVWRAEIILATADGCGTFEVMRRSIEHSLPFGLYRGRGQVGFARAVTDFAVFAYVGDVFVVPAHRGRGLSKWLMETMLAHPDLQGLRRWNLATRDAHGLYRRFGFEPAGPNTMDRVTANPYQGGS